MFSKILIAHDLTTEANQALRRAAQLARQFDAQLVIAHALNDGDAVHAETTLQGVRADIGAPQAQILVRPGKPAEVLLHAVTDVGADLVVTGTHHAGRPEALSGSNLERVARECPVPLLMVRDLPTAPYRHALVALDESACAARALQVAYQLLPCDGRLDGIHIIDEALQLPPELRRQQRDEQLAGLNDLARKALAGLEGGPQPTIDVQPGTLAGSLDTQIRLLAPQLLVLGQHGRSRLSEVLLGSLPAYYLRQPLCDLLLVK